MPNGTSSLGILQQAANRAARFIEDPSSEPGLRFSTPGLFGRATRGILDLASRESFRMATRTGTLIAAGGAAGGLVANGGGSEGLSGSDIVPGGPNPIPGITSGGVSQLTAGGVVDAFTAEECPGLTSVRIGGRCVNLGDLLPGGDPAVTGATSNGVELGAPAGFGQAVTGLFGVGVIPRVEAMTVRRCPGNFVLGQDGVCYERLARSNRAHKPPRKPLLTGGERNAIARAERAGKKLARAQKSLKKASRALGKAC